MAPGFQLDRCRYGFGVTPTHHRAVMAPSRFDLVSSFLLALLVSLAVWVGLLLMIWLLSGVAARFERPHHVPVASGSPVAAVVEQEFELPDAAEVTDLLSPDLANLMADIQSAAQQVMAEYPDPGVGGGLFDGKEVGPDPDGDDAFAESERWELTFVASSQRDYAQQLDSHGIELGVFGGGFEGLDYASSLATGPAARNIPDASGEGRLYFSWLRPNPLDGFERGLLAEAGIPFFGRQIVKFIPAELENRLSQLELEYAHSNGFSSSRAIAKTVFRSQPFGDGYRFTVVSQRYKRGASVVSGDPKN